MTAVEPEPVITSERKKRRKNKKTKVEGDVDIQAPLDPSIFDRMDEDETVSQIQKKSEFNKFFKNIFRFFFSTNFSQNSNF